MSIHIVWDWNGTLKDDRADLLGAVNHTLKGLRAAPIDLATYQARHVLPVRRLYTQLVNRTLTDNEWATAQRDFTDFLRDRPPRLRDEAEPLLARVHSLGHSQSLLSLYPEELLRGEVQRLGITGFFARIDGRRGPDGTKEAVLADHLIALPPDNRSRPFLVIGDSLDDARAARAVGAQPVLFSGGLEPAERLRAAGWPVTDTLNAAVHVGLRRLAARAAPAHPARTSVTPFNPHPPRQGRRQL
ncbi:HAD hydrolase-like protein [Streptomyces sp. NPDC047061]|uniref:HAD family hydrolase n=1 Tax=Streptomyces sp. NPDC047061 TaxID=3154605 RepID=UPI0033D6A86B